MDNLVKLVWSPFIPPLEVVGDIVIKLHFPCSDASVSKLLGNRATRDE